jgi:hypothetical protein
MPIIQTQRSPKWVGLSQKQRFVRLLVGLAITAAVIGTVLLVAG